MAISVSFVSERLSLHIHKGGVSAALLELSGLLNCAGLVSVWEASQWVALGTFFHDRRIQIVQNLLTVKVVRHRRRLQNLFFP